MKPPDDGPLFDEAQIGLLREAIGVDDLLAVLAEVPPAGQKALDDIVAALTANDINQARRAAHILKGFAGTFGAARLALLATEIELELTSVESMRQRIPILAECLGRTVRSLVAVAEGLDAGDET